VGEVVGGDPPKTRIVATASEVNKETRAPRQEIIAAIRPVTLSPMREKFIGITKSTAIGGVDPLGRNSTIL
jgi:hypothetical protein